MIPLIDIESLWQSPCRFLPSNPSKTILIVFYNNDIDLLYNWDRMVYNFTNEQE
jgi:hypothetical protein